MPAASLAPALARYDACSSWPSLHIGIWQTLSINLISRAEGEARQRRALPPVIFALALASCSAVHAPNPPSAAAPLTDARFRNIRRRHPCASRRFPTEASTKLIERFAPLAERLSIALDREVEFTPVTDCAATVEALVTGRVDLAWLGGFTSVQARLRSNGAVEPTGLSQMLQSESSAGF